MKGSVHFRRYLSYFFFQAEDGIRDHCVTGVQTCALPIFRIHCEEISGFCPDLRSRKFAFGQNAQWHIRTLQRRDLPSPRSEEHTSELQSHSDLVCRLLLEKKKHHTLVKISVTLTMHDLTQ